MSFHKTILQLSADLLLSTLDSHYLFINAASPSIFPGRVLAMAAKGLRENKDETKVWDLAQEGWKKVLQNHRDRILNEYVGKLNTPKPKQVNEMFEKLIGMKNISGTWKWPGNPNQDILDSLDRLVVRRGEIAHRVRTQTYVKKKEVIQAAVLIQKTSAICSNRVAEFIHKLTGKSPWMGANFRNAR